MSSYSIIANKWVMDNILAHMPGVKFRSITVGNEVIPGPVANQVLVAMQNLQRALKAANVNILVTTVVSYLLLESSYPPSTGAFSHQIWNVMAQIVTFLSANQYPLLANVYPCFPYFVETTKINADYALGNWNAPVVYDRSLQYNNLFDAMIDAMYAALDKAEGRNVKIVVSETGWPSAGGDFATVNNARTYVNNVIQRVSSGKGTPMRPLIPIEGYIFAMFTENQKPAGTEQNFWLFYPDMKRVYPVNVIV